MSSPFHPHITCSPLPTGKKVKRILVIRLQATGDVIISLPYLQSLRNLVGEEAEIALLVREECADIPCHLRVFNKVYVLRGGRNTRMQLLHFLFMLPGLWMKGYDVLLDLQNHRLSAVMRKLLRVKFYSVYDRTSAHYAGKRYQDTINAVGLPEVRFEVLRSFAFPGEATLMQKFGLKPGCSYIVLNPGGAFENRHWEPEKYVHFARLWQEKVDKETKFVVLGLDKVKEKASYFKKELGEALIDLVNKTSQTEAMVLLRQMKLIVSEDSGLLHMSYVVGTPTIGILGSTRNDWTNPNLPHTRFFHSSDLSCGNCMLETCIHSEVRCLTRLQPQAVVDSAMELLNSEENRRLWS